MLVRFSLLPILYLEAGPELAFNLSTSTDYGSKVTVKADDDAFNTVEFDLVFGVGTGILPLVDIDFRVILGLTNIYDDESIAGTSELDIKNMQFALGATYWF